MKPQAVGGGALADLAATTWAAVWSATDRQTDAGRWLEQSSPPPLPAGEFDLQQP
jgi:hypothetical protein